MGVKLRMFYFQIMLLLSSTHSMVRILPIEMKFSNKAHIWTKPVSPRGNFGMRLVSPKYPTEDNCNIFHAIFGSFLIYEEKIPIKIENKEGETLELVDWISTCGNLGLIFKSGSGAKIEATYSSNGDFSEPFRFQRF